MGVNEEAHGGSMKTTAYQTRSTPPAQPIITVTEHTPSHSPSIDMMNTPVSTKTFSL